MFRSHHDDSPDRIGRARKCSRGETRSRHARLAGRPRWTAALAGGALLAVGALCGASIGGDTAWEIIDLGTLGGPGVDTAPGSVGLAINDAGSVAGFSVTDDESKNLHGFRWSASTRTLADLPPATGDVHAQAFGIAGDGTVVGTSFMLGELQPTAVRWIGVEPEAIGAFVASDVNDDGVIVGEMTGVPLLADVRPVRWTDGVLVELPTLGGASGGARAIDDRGWIVGESLLSNGRDSHATIWRPGAGAADLGTLGGARSAAFDIDGSGADSAIAVGYGEDADGVPHAMRVRVADDGTIIDRTDLGAGLPEPSHAFGVNAAGVVVGSVNDRATRWDADGTAVDLNDLLDPLSGWVLVRASAINEDGAIVGAGRLDGLPRGFLLRPRLPRPADLNGDGRVDGADLSILLAAWGPCAGTCPPACTGDLDGNCAVDGADLSIVLADWGD